METTSHDSGRSRPQHFFSEQVYLPNAVLSWNDQRYGPSPKSCSSIAATTGRPPNQLRARLAELIR